MTRSPAGTLLILALVAAGAVAVGAQQAARYGSAIPDIRITLTPAVDRSREPAEMRVKVIVYDYAADLLGSASSR